MQTAFASMPGPAPTADPAALPTELLVEIFRNLPTEGVAAASAACKGWLRAGRRAELWTGPSERLLAEAAALGAAAAAHADAAALRHFGERASAERLELLRGTLDAARAYVGAQLRGGFWRGCRHPLLAHALFRCLARQLRDVGQMLVGIAAEAYAITCNFDMLDLALRRLCEELRTLVPAVAGYDPPGPGGAHAGVPDPRVYEVIRDPDARAAWATAIGGDVCAAPYDVFERRVVARSFPDALQNPRFAAHLRFHLSFPSTGLVTTYRFQLLLAQFGPFRQLAANFDRFALHPGFVGLVNMIKAEELLIQHFPRLARSTVLIRYSRRQPDVLAFTSIDLASKRIEHRRNVDRSGRPIPVATFLERVFPGYDLFPMGIDDVATRIANLFTFARGVDPYVYTEFSSGSGGSSRSSAASTSTSSSSGSRRHKSHRHHASSRERVGEESAASPCVASGSRTSFT